MNTNAKHPTSAPNATGRANALLEGQLTVVLPNFNHAAYLQQALTSVLEQSRPPKRVIVLDDCSIDNSREIIRSAAAAKSTIEVIENPVRLGVNANINIGLALVDTEFVSFQAADDFIAPSLYETALAGLASEPTCALAVTANQWRNKAGEALAQPADPPISKDPAYLTSEHAFELLARYGSFIAGTGAVYRTGRLRELGFDSKLGPFSDAFVQHQLIGAGGLFYIPQRLASWRKLDGGYAISTQRKASSAVALYAEIQTALRSPEAAAIPTYYRNILGKRLCFDAVRAVLSDTDASPLQAAPLFEAAGARTLYRCATLLGRKPALAAAALALRSSDIWFALVRRVQVRKDR